MVYKVDYIEAETDGYSCKLTIEHRIFYVRLFKSAEKTAQYFVGELDGGLKEISRHEFYFWLDTLADDEIEIEKIKKEACSGKKY
jgi:hypothetical protein